MAGVVAVVAAAVSSASLFVDMTLVDIYALSPPLTILQYC